jgi:hypothetical protein
VALAFLSVKPIGLFEGDSVFGLRRYSQTRVGCSMQIATTGGLMNAIEKFTPDVNTDCPSRSSRVLTPCFAYSHL